MTLVLLIQKIQYKLWSKLASYTQRSAIYPYIYCSYWHCLFTSKKKADSPVSELYYTARPNPGAGIGHQMANWIAGYWYAKQLGLKFAHYPFVDDKWNTFLGFGENETTLSQLHQKGYKKRRLPLFEGTDSKYYDLDKRIIQSYSGRKIIFIAEQDQFYREQYGVMGEIKEKFYHARARTADKLIYLKENFNIAIHVRRGDIMRNLEHNPGLAKRYQSNDYFYKVLQQAVDHSSTSKPVHIYFFSQGQPEDYPEFSSFKNLHWCMDMKAQESFLHMVYADLLITSKSSFSYKPALLNNGLKICPRNFWHGYPDTKDWILAEDDGTFDTKRVTSHE